MEFYKSGNFDKKKSGNRFDSDRKPSDSYRNSRNDRGSRFSRDDRSRGESATVTCADCGTQCEIPFVPKHDRPVYCSDCFRKNKPQDSGNDRYSRNDRNDRYSRNDRNDRYSRNDRGSRFSRDDRSRGESATVTCADCGTQCEIPFVPKHDRPVYCSDCFRKNKPQDSGNDRYSRNDRGSRFSRDDRSRGESATVTCADCGTQCEIPFVPKHDRPVYCSDCFRKNKPQDSGNDRYSRNDRESYSNKNENNTFRTRSKNDKVSKRQEALYSGGSDKFYSTLKEKLFDILGGKTCSSCGFKEERALGICHIYDDDVFDNIRRGDSASSWGKYISEPGLAKKELLVLCLNCNEIRQPISKPKQESAPKSNRKRSKYFPR